MNLHKCFIKVFSRVLIVGTVFFTAKPVAAQQNHFIVPVDFQAVNGTFEGTKVKVLKNGKPDFSLRGKAAMRLKLDFNVDYVLIFSKPGYITKSIEVITNAPAERISNPIEPYKIGVRLFKQYEGINIVIYDQPVAKIQFNKFKDEFDFDTDYSKSILSDLDKTEQQLNTKAAEERLSVSGMRNLIVADDKREQNNNLSNSGQMNQRSLIQKQETPLEKQSLIVDPLHQKKNMLTSYVEGDDANAKSNSTEGEDQPGMLNPGQGTDKAGDVLFSGQGEDTGIQISNNSGDEINNDALHVTGNASYFLKNWKEHGREITTVKVINGLIVAEYRKVNYDWGGIFYFKDQYFTISQNVFQWATGEK